MSVKPRTIDNLGIETSSRYAKDQKLLDKTLIEESRFIPQKAEISVVKPYLPTEFEHYSPSQPLTFWAAFEPPPDFFDKIGILFSYQLIPSLGGYEKQEADTDRLQAIEDALDKPFKEGDKEGNKDSQKEKQKKVLLTLLKTIDKLDRVLTMINSRRGQYQRG